MIVRYGLDIYARKIDDLDDVLLTGAVAFNAKSPDFTRSDAGYGP
jgi:hypothetical protein